MFSYGELLRVTEEIPQHYRAFVLLLGLTGLRIGEAAALTLADVDLDATDENGDPAPEVSISKAVAEVNGKLEPGDPKTPGSSRTIVMPYYVAQEIRDHIERKGIRFGNALLFTNEAGGQIKRTEFRRQVWLPALKRSGIDKPVRVHDLRMTAVALMIDEGAHPKDIQEVCGHSSIAITMDQYGGLFPARGSSIAARLDAGIRAAVTRGVTREGFPKRRVAEDAS
jgi:integrase